MEYHQRSLFYYTGNFSSGSVFLHFLWSHYEIIPVHKQSNNSVSLQRYNVPYFRFVFPQYFPYEVDYSENGTSPLLSQYPFQLYHQHRNQIIHQDWFL